MVDKKSVVLSLQMEVTKDGVGIFYATAPWCQETVTGMSFEEVYLQLVKRR